jgi:hypothetical protein
MLFMHTMGSGPSPNPRLEETHANMGLSKAKLGHEILIPSFRESGVGNITIA